jgi:hypothetical protein
MNQTIEDYSHEFERIKRDFDRLTQTYVSSDNSLYTLINIEQSSKVVSSKTVFKITKTLEEALIEVKKYDKNRLVKKKIICKSI